LGNAAAGPFASTIALGASSGAETVEHVTVTANAGNDSLSINQVVFSPVTFDGGADTDTLTFNASNGSDTDITIAAGSITGGGNTVTYSTAPENITVNALASDDIIYLAYNPAGTALTVNAGIGNDTFKIGVIPINNQRSTNA